MKIEVFTRLNEDGFRDLIAGKEVEITSVIHDQTTMTVKLILADIGWDRMAQAIRDAQDRS